MIYRNWKNTGLGGVEKLSSPQFRMRSIAIGRGAGLLAGAERNRFFFIWGEGHGGQRRDFMGAVAKWLTGRSAAAAPVIGFARLQF